MKLIIESTTKFVEISADGGDPVPARVWEGHTDTGIPVHCFITRVAVGNDQDQKPFERELQEHRAPSADIAAIPLRLIL